MNKDLLFEIGTEEIPAHFMPKALEQVKKLAETALKENRIDFSEIQSFGTPRRIVLFIKEIAEKQKDLEQVIKGPSKKAAFDAEGNPTKALLGFLKSQNSVLEDTFVQELSGAEYIYIKKHEKGKETKEVLKTILPQIMTSITFPKSMKWGNKSFRFARPIRWLLPLLGDELIEFDKDGILCSRVTKGHRVLSKGDIEIGSTAEYFEKLREGYVIVDQNERRNMIVKQCELIAESKGGRAIIDEELLEEIVFLVEYPTALIGNFEEEYLKLPKEAIITPMKEHQRYFPVMDKDNKLMPYFIAVRNGNEAHIDIVREGNERVLRARLADAKFFYNEDKKIPLDACVEKLKHVVFQETLGTIYDKTVRIKEMANYLADALNLDCESKKNLERAAELCKADLVSGMVKEFDELQGIMGREYAILQGEKKEVADAILEHYLPRFSGDSTPETKNGAVLSIADKLDTITGCFAIGIQPTGSQDPYALRRQAIAIISIVLQGKLHLSLTDMIGEALKPFAQKGILKGDADSIGKDVIEFFKGRFKNVLMDKGYEYDVIDSVINADFNDIYDAYLKVLEIANWKNKEEFLCILSTFNRVSNLASKAQSSDIDQDALTEEAEKALVEAYYKAETVFDNAILERKYNEALRVIITLKAPIDNFFENIMVMVEDEDIKRNRLAVLKSISNMMNRFADLGSIVVK